jgi:hypothetical protein
MIPERRSCVRHKVNGPAYASFDGVTGGFILDLSEQGLAMQTVAPLESQRRGHVGMNLPDDGYVETTGYVAWADALGRAGVRFSDLPEEARRRLDQWLARNASSRSYRAPKFSLSDAASMRNHSAPAADSEAQPWAITLEPTTQTAGVDHDAPGMTVEYEFRPLGSDLPATLRLIGERARSLTRGTGAVIALGRQGSLRCRASVGACAPALGARLDASSGFSGECVRTGKALRCDDTEEDSRVEIESCRRLGIRSILAAPIQDEREIVGLLEVLSNRPYAFEASDIAIVERLAQTVLLTVIQMEGL